MGKKAKALNRVLIYLVLLCVFSLSITAYLFYQESQEVKRLNAQRDLLINKLAERVVAHKKLIREHDSLLQYLQEQKPASDTAKLVRAGAKRKL